MCVDAQTHTDWEHLICSDGPSERHVEHLIESDKNEKRRYACLEKHCGDYANTVRSTMLQGATGKYVLFLDDDNIIMPEYLEWMIDALNKAYAVNNKVGFAICQVYHFGPLPAPLGKPPKVIDGIPPKVQNIDTLQVLAFTEAMKDVGWNLEHGYLADGYTFEAMAKKYEYAIVSTILGVHL
jgi:glycosyltransferase involved in cell wall biosynthesis